MIRSTWLLHVIINLTVISELFCFFFLIVRFENEQYMLTNALADNQLIISWLWSEIVLQHQIWDNWNLWFRSQICENVCRIRRRWTKIWCRTWRLICIQNKKSWEFSRTYKFVAVRQKKRQYRAFNDEKIHDTYCQRCCNFLNWWLHVNHAFSQNDFDTKQSVHVSLTIVWMFVTCCVHCSRLL